MRKAVIAALLLLSSFVLPQAASATAPHHFIFHQGTSSSAQTSAHNLGYDYQDVASKTVMDALPAGVTGVFWIGNYDNATCGWDTGTSDDTKVQSLVQSVATDSKFSGIFFVADEPHTYTCPNAASQIATRTANVKTWAAAVGNSNVKTFVDVAWHAGTCIPAGSGTCDEYKNFYSAGAADYYGADPYPCGQTGGGAYMGAPGAEAACNWTSFVSKIQQATTDIPAAQLVPVFQSTGEDKNSSVCTGVLTDTAPFYTLPEADQEQTIQADWDQYLPSYKRTWDATYEWLTGWNSCPELSQANGTVASSVTGYNYPDLQTSFKNYFAAEVPASSTFSPSDDTYVSTDFPNDQSGSQTTMSTSYDSSTSMSRELVKFTVSGVGTKHVTSATVTFKVNNGTGTTANVYPISSNAWAEGTATWNNQPAEGASTIASIPSATTGSTVTVDLTNYITGDGTYSFGINETTSDALILDTKESGTSTAPVLSITAQK